jgi:hypothetical protein
MRIKQIKEAITKAQDGGLVRLCFADGGPEEFDVELDDARLDGEGDLIIFAHRVYASEYRHCPNCDQTGTLFDINNGWIEECSNCGKVFKPEEVDAYVKRQSEP